jgi:hypothetical protein
MGRTARRVGGFRSVPKPLAALPMSARPEFATGINGRGLGIRTVRPHFKYAVESE